jgi:hypothetical protein
VSKTADAVYSADLRNSAIPCGDCDFEEEHVSDHDKIERDIRRLDTELEGHVNENLRAITALQTNYSHITHALESQGRILEQIDKRMAHIEVAVGGVPALKERLDVIEGIEKTRSEHYIPRHEYNASLISVRQYAENEGAKATAKADKVEGRLTMMVWGVGLTLAGISGVVGFIAARVFV